MTMPIEDVLEGKYEILEKIGEGGIGSVYKVRHRLLDEVRVIKVLRPQVANKEDHQERFLFEARMAIRLKHPNIAQLHDFSISDEGTAFIVMEFIDGIALDALLKGSGPPSLELSMEISRQALRALGYLHSHNLVHRDVAPDNLMLTTGFDGAARVKLIDLGIAKNLEEESNLTQTGVFLGKVRYCSPEQFSSAEDQNTELDHRSDIYSFGLLLYELLTGVYPFSGKTFAELAGCHLFQPPISFDETDAEGRIPEELRQVILKSIAKAPEDRFASAADFLEHLEPFGDPEESVEEELSRTVERTTSAIPNLKNYTRPGSTQDRLNAQFGLGTTTAPTPLGEGKAKTTVAPGGGAKAVSTGATSSSIPWKWIGGLGGAAAVIAAIAFVALSGDASEPSPAAAGDAIEIAETERFSPPESSGDLGQLLTVTPPPTEDDPPADPETSAGSEESRPGTEPPSQLEEDRRPPEDRRAAGPGPRPGDPPPRRPPPGGPPAGRTTDIYQVGVGVMAPVLVKMPDPMYPDGKRPRSDVEVKVAILVDEHGNVLTARVESGAGFRRRYRDAAIETAKAATFRPAIKNGIAGRMWTELKIVFKSK